MLLAIFSPPDSHHPWAKIIRGSGSPIALSIVGQYTVCVVRMSLPMRWQLAGHRANASSSRR